uniref:C-type lectin domain-containing protein n=1 Tax=Mastacembelus armatus TaxID=205130 RepID=A0A3Q3NNQ4_9TELE
MQLLSEISFVCFRTGEGDLCSYKHGTYCSHGTNILYNTAECNWSSALQYCQVNNYNLVTIASLGLANLKQDNLQSTGWIGLYREGGDSWKWTGSTQSNYRKWAPEQPLNSDCGYFNPYTTKWYSNVCSNELQKESESE